MSFDLPGALTRYVPQPTSLFESLHWAPKSETRLEETSLPRTQPGRGQTKVLAANYAGAHEGPEVFDI